MFTSKREIMSKIEFYLLDLEMERVSETEINKAVDCLKNGGMAEIVDKVSDMGKVNPPEKKEVIKSFSGASHVQSFFVFVQERKECGRKSFNH